MTALCKSYLAKLKNPFRSVMSTPFYETLQQERARLLRAVINLFPPRECETDLTELFLATSKLRQLITDTLQRYTDELSKDDLVRLQSSLHAVADEQFASA